MTALWSRFEHEIKRSLGGAPKTSESACCDDFPNPGFTGLRAQTKTNFLRERGGNTDHRRSRIVNAAHGIQVGFDVLVGKGLDDHPRAVSRQCLSYVARGSRRIAHVVQAVKESYEVVV